MSGTLIFIEKKDDVRLLEKFVGHETVIISMAPSVSVELAQRNIAYQNTISFFGKECHRYILEQSTKIIEGVRPFLEVISAEEVQCAFEKTWIFYFRFYLHYWLAMLCLIDKAVQIYKPDSFIVIGSNNVDRLSIETIDNNLLGVIVKYYGDVNRVNTQYVNKKNYRLSGKVNNLF